ncbi:MAG: sec-independent protein translocase protein TatB [Alphaproteobacteria bacterium]|nr:sec-independent protein translocase protein TatB [Alphaproteobacteria bacterium]
MFDIGWGELLLIGIVALIAIGPKELPGALRTLGQWMNKIRRMAAEFQGQFQEAMREAELADLKKEVDEMAAKAQSYAHFDPMEDVRKDIEKSMGDFPPMDAPAPDAPTAAGTPVSSSSADLPPPGEGPAPAAAEPASAPVEPAPAAAAAPYEPDPGPAAVPKPDAGRAA